MIFRIFSTSIYKPTKEKLLEKFPFLSEFCLKDLGYGICTIKIKNIEDLLHLHDLVIYELILDKASNNLCEAIGIKKSIEIYDDWRE